MALTLAIEFVRRGHRVTVLMSEAAGELLPLLPPEVEIRDLHAPRVRSLLGPVTRYLRGETPDALLVFMWPLTVVATLAGRLSGGRTRIVLSDHAVLSHQYADWGRWHARALAGSVRLAYPRAHGRVAVSRGAADDLARLGGIPSSSVRVIYNPVPEPARPLATTPAVEALWPGEGPRILAVGSLEKAKNFPLLLEAFAKLPPDLGARLMILGEGSERGRLASQATQLGIAEAVAMPGFALDPWPYYASADLFVLSSSQEGFANVIVEALHAGLRVVSTDCPHGPKEILAGGHGMLVSPGDAEALSAAMVKALAEPARPDEARRRAQHFAGDAAFAAYEQILFG